MKDQILSYNYDISTLIIAISYSLLGSISFFNIIQKIRYINNLKVAILLIIISSISVSTLCVWTTHFLIIFSMKFENKFLYLNINLTMLSLLTAIALNSIGFAISFFPFLMRASREYNDFIKNEITFDENKSTSQLKIKNEISIVNQAKYISFLDFFNKTKFIRSEYINILIGGLFIGPSIILLHFVGMHAIQFDGIIEFQIANHIWIFTVGILVCFVINYGFFGRDNIVSKAILATLISATVIAIHLISVNCTSFKGDNDEATNESSSNLNVSIDQCSKLVFALGAVFNYLFKLVVENFLNKSCFVIKIWENFMSDENNDEIIQLFMNNFIIEKNKIRDSQGKHNKILIIPTSDLNLRKTNMMDICNERDLSEQVSKYNNMVDNEIPHSLKQRRITSLENADAEILTLKFKNIIYSI